MNSNTVSGDQGNSNNKNYPSTNTRNNPFANNSDNIYPGNTVIGSGQWIIPGAISRENFASLVGNTFDGVIDTIFQRLRERLPLEESKNQFGASNPFAGGNNPFADGRNPFGEGNLPEVPAYDSLVSQNKNYPLPPDETLDFLRGKSSSNQTNTTSSDGNNLTSIYNPVTEGGNPNSNEDLLVSSNLSGNTLSTNDNTLSTNENPLATTSNLVTDNSTQSTSSNLSTNNNQFASFGGQGNNTTGASSNTSTQPEFDVVNFIFGGSAPSLNSSSNEPSNTNLSPVSSNSQVLRNVQTGLTNFTKTFSSNIAANPFGGNTTPLQTPSDLLRLFRTDMYTFNRSANAFSELLGKDNPFGGGNKFVNDSNIGETPFDIISVALEGILPFSGSGENVFTTSESELPIGNGNRDFGSENASIGNANWNYGKSIASVGNGNWNLNSTQNNATIGNGNWHWDKSENNKTVGNGNWYWDETNDNSTLGNGNWNFGNDNTTIGNGNWNFGSNNTVIGNGNRVFTSNSIVIGNGNWSVVVDKSSSGANNLLNQLDSFVLSMGIKDTANNLVNTVMNSMGKDFLALTGNVSESGMQTYNRIILSQGL